MSKKKMMAELTKLNLPVRPFFYPFSMLPAFKHNKTGNKKINPVAYSVSERGITLPSSFGLNEQDVKIYCDAIKQILKK
jgi:dTDP-4-amino-4,6-dideoxygalactose transaminase